MSFNPKVGSHSYGQDNTVDTDYNPQTTSAERLVVMLKKGAETRRQFLENIERGLFIKPWGTITEELEGAKNAITI